MISAGFGQKRELLLGGFADNVSEMGWVIAGEAMIGELRAVIVTAGKAG
jgi:hypothetical protein